MIITLVGNASVSIPQAAFKRAYQQSSKLIAADGGAEHCHALGVRPDILVGDMDSISPELFRELCDQGVELKRYPADKDETDFELAVARAMELEASKLHIFGWSDERFDYSWSNLMAVADSSVPVALYTENSLLRILNPFQSTEQLTGPLKLSVVPLKGPISLSSQGLRWELNWQACDPGSVQSQSNQLVGGNARLELEAGVALLVLEQGH